MESVWVKGVRFNLSDYDKLVSDELLTGQSLKQKNRPFIIFTPNPEQVVEAWDNRQFGRCLNKSDLNLIDGIGVVWWLKLKRKIQVKRVSGVDYAWQLLTFLSQHKGRLFLLGASDEVNKKVVKVVKSEFPGLTVMGESGGIVSDNGQVKEEVIDTINSFKPDLLLVAFGAPKQEMFVCRYKDKLRVKVVMVIGGAFDYWAKAVPRAPYLVRRLGLEWFFRLIRQPWRLKRQIKLVRFIIEGLEE